MKRSDTKRTKRGRGCTATDVSKPATATPAHATEKIEQTTHALKRHQVNKLVERVKAGGELSRADLGLLKQLGEKFASNQAASDSTATTEKKRRGRPPQAEEIQILELETIQERQLRGEKRTSAEHAFLAKVQRCTLVELSAAATTQAAEATLTKLLLEFKERIFESLCWAVQYSKSHMARVSAVHTLRAWAYEENCPAIPYRFVVAPPELEEVTPANAGVVPMEATIK